MIRVLHLSDLHFSKNTSWDADPVRKGLIKELERLVAGGLAPHLVAITGDIAFSGSTPEYVRARDWIDNELLRALPDVPKTRVLIIPGNHDVDRSKVGVAAQGLERLLLEEKSQSKIARVLRNKDDRGVLLKRHAAYMKFAAEYGPRTRGKTAPVPWWSTTVPADDGRPGVFIAGICSSWMCGGESDHGNLLLGRWQVNEVFKKAPDEIDFRIALLHHPWSFLAEFDSRELQETVFRNVDVVLRGHLHAQRSFCIYDPDNVCLELAAGAIYDGSEFANAFQLIELLPKERIARVHYSLWKDGKWIVDRNAYKGALNGIAEFDLADRSSRVGTAAASRPPDPSAYLKRLREKCQYIDIRGLQTGTGKAHRFPIDELYIPLTTHGSAEKSDKRHRGKHIEELEPGRAEPVDLRDCLKHRCLVVLGDPGAGKTTFLRRVAFELCRKQLGEGNATAVAPWSALGDAFPILVPLADLARHRTVARERNLGPIGDDVAEWLVHFAATRAAETGVGLDEAFFRRVLKDGRAIVLLDALDEVPSTEARLGMRTLIENAVADYAKCRFIVTSRPAAFVGDVVLNEFEQARIAPLEDEAIETFLCRWCRALLGENEAKEHLDELLIPLRKLPEVRRMARNPVMLTALAVVHWNEKRLPEQRAELYESIIGWLAKQRLHSEGRPKPEQCVALLQNLALAMQDHPKGRQTQVSRHWGARAIAPSFREVPEDERVSAAEAFLSEEEVDSGIIVGRGEHEIRFWHLTFQEYLGARGLAARTEKVQAETLLATDKLYAQEWREVVLLMAGVLHRQGIERVDGMFETILAKVKPKAPLKAKARCAGLLNAILGDLGPVGYKPDNERYAAVIRDALAIFDAKRSKGIPIKVAIEAAEAIARGGDPRFTDQQRKKNWIEIPSGKFLMGAQSKDEAAPNYDSEAYDDESPVHEVHLKAYRIGKYPVTVGEYERFVGADGYAIEAHWKAGGFGDKEQPGDWDEQLTHLNCPVTYVSWYEATAYAHWAECRLPSEAEWERAARGAEGRRFPWGEEVPSGSHANYGSNIGNPTPVGVYPRGGTPEETQDMAGNAWEWCADWHGAYDRDNQVDPAGAGAGSSRVLHGGSWGNLAIHLRSAYRSGYRPDIRDDNIGFRVSVGT